MTPVLEDMFIEDLRELHGTENAQVTVLKQLAEAASSPDLVNALQKHAETTRRQLDRLGKIFSLVEEQPTGEPPDAVRALIADAQKKTGMDADNEIIDLAIISAARKLEHLEMAEYSTIHSMAHAMGLAEAVRLIDESLREEQNADRVLSRIAEPLLKAAEEVEDDVEVEIEEDETILQLPDISDEVEEKPKRKKAA